MTGEIVIDAESIEVEVQNALLFCVARIAHPDMGVETSRSLRQRFVDRLLGGARSFLQEMRVRAKGRMRFAIAVTVADAELALAANRFADGRELRIVRR